MDNKNNSLSNKSNSFSSPPSDLLNFVGNGSESSNNTITNKPQEKIINTNSSFVPVIDILGSENMNTPNNIDIGSPQIHHQNKFINYQGNDNINNNASNNPTFTGLNTGINETQNQGANFNENSEPNEEKTHNKFINFDFMNENRSSNTRPFQSSSIFTTSNSFNNPYGLKAVIDNTVKVSADNNNSFVRTNNTPNQSGASNEFIPNGNGTQNNIFPAGINSVHNNIQNKSIQTNGTNIISESSSEKISPKINDSSEYLSTIYNNSDSLSEQDNSESIAMVQRLMQETLSPKIELEKKTKKENKLFFALSIASGVAFVAVLLFAIFGEVNIFNFSIEEVYYENKNIAEIGDYQTAVVTDNKWKVEFDSNKDERTQAIEFIKKDSNNQKEKCSNESVKKIEQEIEEKYGIIAVNFCELDYNFAKEIRNMIALVYKEFPIINSELTNLTLQNNSESAVYASFKSAQNFAKSTSLTGYPQIYKMSIFLNAQNFLDPSFRETVRIVSLSGYFPNGSTRSSIVAHEFGHYLSFLAHLHNSNLNKLILITRKNFRAYAKLINESDKGVFSKKMLDEALSNARKNGYTFNDLDEFRYSISEYAYAVDNSGNPLYDETIAEAFHDYYLHKNNAKPASLEIVKVLKKYLSN